MNWNPYPQTRPETSQPYLVSVSRKYGNGDFTFNYVAYYDAENNHWYKYDGFDNDSQKDRIQDHVTGWIQLTTFLGMY